MARKYRSFDLSFENIGSKRTPGDTRIIVKWLSTTSLKIGQLIEISLTMIDIKTRISNHSHIKDVITDTYPNFNGRRRIEWIIIWIRLILHNWYADVLMQDCSNSIDSALESLQSCTKPSIFTFFKTTINTYRLLSVNSIRNALTLSIAQSDQYVCGYPEIISGR